MVLKRTVCVNQWLLDLLGAGVLGDGLGALTDSVLGKLTRQQETDSSLDLSASDGGTLVVVGKAGSFTGDTLEDIIDKAVHDAHGFAGDTGVGVHLLHYFVDVDAVALSSLPPSLLVTATGAGGLGLTAGLLGAL